MRLLFEIKVDPSENVINIARRRKRTDKKKKRQKTEEAREYV